MNVLVQHRLDRERLLAETDDCPECGVRCDVCYRNECCCLRNEAPEEQAGAKDLAAIPSRQAQGEEEVSLD